MVKAHELKPNPGARTDRRRVGRGDGSGMGSYSTRGLKGQKARAGGGARRGFEGGQNPLMKGLPMLRGFTNIFRVEYTEVNLERLTSFLPGARVSPVEMQAAGLIKNASLRVKVLARGDVDKPLRVAAHRFSKAARAAIEAAGGAVEEL
ncbi:MAG: 50S ribosomal protein L15 [Chloroflexi bacterium]|nr:50S ribosomal protein L15 [Chloroflexota bacterium]MBI4198165.1 50S ribosomal protein L15 [Chloroflexota bacterium]